MRQTSLSETDDLAAVLRLSDLLKRRDASLRIVPVHSNCEADDLSSLGTLCLPCTVPAASRPAGVSAEPSAQPSHLTDGFEVGTAEANAYAFQACFLPH